MSPVSSDPPPDSGNDSPRPYDPSESPTKPFSQADQPTRPIPPGLSAWGDKEDLVGKTISQYEITERLGAGGMGVVYKAQDTRLNRTVALKFLSPQFLNYPELRQRFVHEAQAAAGLDDPHICTVHEIHEAGEHTFIVMAYVEGQSLKDRIASGPVEMREALDIARQIGRGLSRAHRQGIVHRDIKPGNVLLTPEGQVKIVDFGLAKLASRTQLTRTGTSMGTVSYMSPEQARGDEIDQRTDVWALGVVLYEMLTGELPFRGDNEQAVIHSILRTQPRAVSDTRKDASIGVERVVERALAKTPEKRYPGVDEMLADLEPQIRAVQLGQGPGRFARLRRFARKRTVQYAALGVLAVTALVVGVDLYQARASAIDSVAVLPFANLSGDTGQEYYSDGMTDALINALGHIGALRVTSRTSVMKFKHTDKSLPEIAKELNVDAIVEASVLRDGDEVRITAQLVRADPEEQLWADSYTRDAADVLSLHSQVARAIAERIQVTVTPEQQAQLASARPVDPKAYEAYLIGMSLVHKWTRDEVERGIGYLEKALEHDPDYAPASAGLATAYLFSAVPGGGWRSPVEVIDKARDAAQRALELDESLAEAHTALAGVSLVFDWNIGKAERESDRAIELDPGLADAQIAKVIILKRLGGTARLTEAIEHLETALRTDPLNPWARAHLVWTYLQLGDTARVYEECQRLLDLNPEPVLQAQGIIARSFIALKAGRMEEARAGFERSVKITGRQHPDMLMFLGWFSEITGNHENAVATMNEMRELSRERYVSPVLFAKLYASMGNVDAAFEELERAYELRCGYLYDITGLKAQLGSDPRWADLVKRIGLPESAPLS